MAGMQSEIFPFNDSVTVQNSFPAMRNVHIFVTVTTFLTASFAFFLDAIYIKLIQIEGGALSDDARLVIRSGCVGGIVFSSQCIVRSIFSLISSATFPTDIVFDRLITVINRYWICALIDTPYVLGFVAAISSRTILLAEFLRNSVPTFLSTLKNRRAHWERYRKRSIRKAIVLSWFLGLFIAITFVLVAIIQSLLTPSNESNDAQAEQVYCSLIFVVPQPIFYSVASLYVFFEFSSYFTLLIYQWRFHQRRKHKAGRLNRARTDLRERFKIATNVQLWTWLWPSVVLHKVLVAVTLIIAVSIKFHTPQSGDDTTATALAVQLCALVAELSLFLPTLLDIYRSVHLHSCSVSLIQHAANAAITKIRRILVRYEGRDGQRF